jgi:predicted nucleotidyltransferase
MSGIEKSVIDSIVRWAAEIPEVRRVWVSQSRATGDHRPNSDIDIAIELEPVGDSEETLTRWVFHAHLWESQLQGRVAAKIDLEWFDPDGSTRTIEAGLNEATALMYERAG